MWERPCALVWVMALRGPVLVEEQPPAVENATQSEGRVSRTWKSGFHQRRSDVANVFGVSVDTFRSACLLRGRVE